MKTSRTVTLVVAMLLTLGVGSVTEGLAQMELSRPLITFMLQNRNELKLTPDQVTSLESLRSAFGKEATRISADMRRTELELEELLGQETVDLSRAEATIRKGASLMVELHLGQIKTIEEGKALLSAEQKKTLKSLLEKTGVRSRGRDREMMGPGMMERGAPN